MTSIKLTVSGASARAEVDGLLTSGMVGIPVTIVCDGAWDGLTKAVVCRAGSIVKTILNVGGTATVAHECMVPNQTLFIGIEGRNADGTLVIPTVWARCGLICSGANADADPSTDPTLPVWAQLQTMIGNLDELETTARDNLVAAINEALTKGGGEVDPEAVQQIVEDYLAANPPTVTESDPTVPAWAKQPTKPAYTAAEVGALPDTYTPPNQTAQQVGADPAGTAASAVSQHNTDTTAHNDLRLALQELANRINAALDSDDTTLDQLSEVVSYIKSNRSLIDSITTSKVSVTDIVNDLATNVSNKPLSASQGVALKALIDAITIPTALPNPNALTFTGAVTGSYDGSAPMSVEIPSGGTGGGGDVFELIGEATSSGVSDTVGLTIPFDGSLYKTIIAYAYNLPAGNNKRIIIRKSQAWWDGYPLGWNGAQDTYLTLLTNMKNTWGFFGAAIDVGGKLFTLGAAEANGNGGHGYFRFWPQNGALPTLSLSDCKFISLDCNSNSEILPDGCSLIVWGVRK